jgi:hypothetical protein
MFFQISSIPRQMSGGVEACDRNSTALINVALALPRKSCNDSPERI